MTITIVPCMDCGVDVELAAGTPMKVMLANGLLRRVKEPPLEPHEIARCSDCCVRWRGEQDRRSVFEFQEAHALIRDLEAGRMVSDMRKHTVSASWWGHLLTQWEEDQKTLHSQNKGGGGRARVPN
jgi:hypothetical protein